MVPWSGCVPSLKETILDASLSRDVLVERTTLFLETRKVAF